MPSRIPQPADGGAHSDELDSGLSPELLSVVAGARRRAARDGDRGIDTAHLLHSLLESDPEVRRILGDGAQVARLLGYLVQRSIGYGLRWQSAVEDSGAVPVVKATGWSPTAALAMRRASRRAVRRGAPEALGLDLLGALLADPRSRAVEVLGRAGVKTAELLPRVEAAQEACARGGEPPRQ